MSAKSFFFFTKHRPLSYNKLMKEAEKMYIKKKSKAQRRGTAGNAALYGMMIALSLLLSYVETLIPISLAIPGVKLGLANLVSIVGLYIIGIPGTVAITLVRIVLVGFTFGNMFSMLYGLAGAAVSLSVMILCRKRDWLSQTGVSIAGGVGHNVGQILVAAAVVENSAVFYYLPFLLLAGTVAGGLIGALGGIITKRIGKYARSF